MHKLSQNDLVKIKFAGLLIAVLLSFVGVLEGSRYFIIPASQSIVYDDYFHTTWSIQFDASPARKETYATTSENLLSTLDRYYNRYSAVEDVTTLYTLNHDGYGSGEWMVLDQEFYTLLKEAYEWTIISGGAFNMFVGAYVDLWFPHLLLGDGYPTTQQLAAADLCVPSIDQLLTSPLLEFNEEDSSIKFNSLTSCPSSDSVVITLGGYAKGYAVDRLINEAGQLDKLYINGGASSIYLGDFGEEGKTLNFYNPLVFDGSAPSDEQIGLTLMIPSFLSVSTSGDYQQGYLETINDEPQWLHHIVDSTTGWPSHYYRAVTVITESSGDADAISTALMNLPLEEAFAWLDELKLAGITVTAYFMVETNDTISIHHYDGGHEVEATSRFTII